MNRRRRGGIVCALSVLLLSSACSSDEQGPEAVSTAEAYAAVIRWYAEQNPLPVVTEPGGTVDDDPDPMVVHIAPADGNPIEADAQAAVVADLAEMSDRISAVFENVGDDALDVEAENRPVKDDAVLLLVGPVIEGPPPVEVSIVVYYDETDQTSYQMRIVRSGSDDHTVTAVTQLAQS